MRSTLPPAGPLPRRTLGRTALRGRVRGPLTLHRWCLTVDGRPALRALLRPLLAGFLLRWCGLHASGRGLGRGRHRCWADPLELACRLRGWRALFDPIRREPIGGLARQRTCRRGRRLGTTDRRRRSCRGSGRGCRGSQRRAGPLGLAARWRGCLTGDGRHALRALLRSLRAGLRLRGGRRLHTPRPAGALRYPVRREDGAGPQRVRAAEAP
jgi:hypothetical protein